MVSFRRMLKPFTAVPTRLRGTRWVVPSNDITRAVHASLSYQSRPLEEFALAFDRDESATPAAAESSAQPVAGKPSKRGSEAA